MRESTRRGVYQPREAGTRMHADCASIDTPTHIYTYALGKLTLAESRVSRIGLFYSEPVPALDSPCCRLHGVASAKVLHGTTVIPKLLSVVATRECFPSPSVPLCMMVVWLTASSAPF